LLGSGTAGFFVDANGRATPWRYTDGGAWGEAWLDLGEAAGPRTMGLVEPPFRLAVPNPRVAVLTDVGVASSGETMAIAFRGRPNTRSFGTPTCGLSTGVEQFPLTRGGRIGVVTSLMADRTKEGIRRHHSA
jgi:C-terminal processing protease CtpA/Prc